jgi:hypothetical protein
MEDAGAEKVPQDLSVERPAGSNVLVLVQVVGVGFAAAGLRARMLDQ